MTGASSHDPSSPAPRPEASRPAIVRCFGVDYLHQRTGDGGDLYLTPHGAPLAPLLQPERWHADRWYLHHGRQLPGSTGSVYRCRTQPVGDRSLDLVVKFSRVGQEVPLLIATGADAPSETTLAGARFNSPFEEFGLLEELRRGVWGPSRLRIRTKKPLAVYAPPKRYELWTLGRSTGRLRRHQRSLALDQARETRDPVQLDAHREYVLLYQWIRGEDAETLAEQGLLDEAQLARLSHRVAVELAAKGFAVLDHKPKHIILRPGVEDRPVRRHGEIAYALVDFELLTRTPAYERALHVLDRVRHFEFTHDRSRPPGQLGPGLQRVAIHGLDYVTGATRDGGRLWMPGGAPGLFELLRPGRWRDTPRDHLAEDHPVYRTRTADGLDIVYRPSRVGQNPRPGADAPGPDADPGVGFNSPFEEFTIAMTIREAGLPAILPRAIHASAPVPGSPPPADPSRFRRHAGDVEPDTGEPALAPDRRYTLIWGDWHAIGAGEHPRSKPGSGSANATVREACDLCHALDAGLLHYRDARRLLEHAQHGFAEIGLAAPDETRRLLLLLLEPGRFALQRDARGRAFARLCLDADRLRRSGLLTDAEIDAAQGGWVRRLTGLGLTTPGVDAGHLLLAVSPEGRLDRDRNGAIATTLCNFERISFKAT